MESSNAKTTLPGVLYTGSLIYSIFHRYAKRYHSFIAPAILLITLSCVSATRTDQSATSAYFSNRAMDSRDIFSFTVDSGIAGAWTDVSYLRIGLGGQVKLGLTPSDIEVDSKTGSSSNLGGSSLGLDNGEIGLHDSQQAALLIVGLEQVHPKDPVKRTRLNFRNKNPNIFILPMKKNYSDSTRIGVALGLFLGMRVSFNIGELADFLLGIGGVDIFDDDIYGKATTSDGQESEKTSKEKEETNKEIEDMLK